MGLVVRDGLQNRFVFCGAGMRIEISIACSNLKSGMITLNEFRAAIRYAYCGAEVENAPLLGGSSLQQERKPIRIGDAMIAAGRIAEQSSEGYDGHAVDMNPLRLRIKIAQLRLAVEQIQAVKVVVGDDRFFARANNVRD